MFTNALLIATASAIKVREGGWVPDGTEVDLGADSVYLNVTIYDGLNDEYHEEFMTLEDIAGLVDGGDESGSGSGSESGSGSGSESGSGSGSESGSGSGSESGSGSGTGSGSDSGDEEGCQAIAYEENDMGHREWCEAGCMLAGGQMVGPIDTDRGTVKTYCQNKDWDTNELFCDEEFTYEGWGETHCDNFCGPFGGTYRDNGMGMMFCDWTEGTDPMGACPQEWQKPSWDGMTTECDTYCLGTGGHYVWNEEHDYEDCEYSNMRPYVPLFPEDQ